MSHLSLFLCLAGFIFGVSTSHLVADPKLRQEFLDMVPGGKIDLDLIIEIAYRFSDSAQSIRAELEYDQLALLEAKAQNQLEQNFSNELLLIEDRFDALGAFNPSSSRIMRFESSFQQQLESGTSMEARLSLARTSQDLSEQARFFGFKESFAQGEAGITLRQSLWRNRFGRSTRLELEVAKLSPEALKANYNSDLSQWFLELSALYYQAWLAQRNVEANEERIKTQKRLLEITRLSWRRGTAERADVLNIESQVLLAEKTLLDAVKQLQDIWRQLLVALKLPERFFGVDPQEVPMIKNDRFQESERLCKNSGGSQLTTPENPRLNSLDLALKRLRMQQAASRDRLNPDLYGLLGVSANSFGNYIEGSFAETARLDNPRFTAGVGINMNLGQAAEKSALSNIARQIRLLEIDRNILRDQLRVQWINQCDEVRRLRQAIQTQNRIIEMTRQRLSLEEERFQLGRVDIVNVISASNDLISARLSLEQSEQQMAQVIWQLKDIYGEIPPYVNAVANRNLIKGR